ncbi:MAG: hypothetical protein EB021_12750 [Gammaproteobacteria bacterium]|nr:hypothetical protein [Gammaproteobacteria bacterium]
MTSDIADIRTEIRLLREEVMQLRDRHLVVNKKYSETLESLKILTHQSAEAARRASRAALGRDGSTLC